MFNVTVQFSKLIATDVTGLPASTLDSTAWSAYQVGFVNCSITDFCTTVSGNECGGWKPDPLLPAIGSSGDGDVVAPYVPSGHTQSIFMEVCVSRTTSASNYTGTIVVSVTSADGAATLVKIPAQLEVWPIVIPEVNSTDAWKTVFSFTPDMRAQYPKWQPTKPGSGSNTSMIMRRWYDFQTQHRMPADYLYGGDFAESTYDPLPGGPGALRTLPRAAGLVHGCSCANNV